MNFTCVTHLYVLNSTEHGAGVFTESGKFFFKEYLHHIGSEHTIEKYIVYVQSMYLFSYVVKFFVLEE